MIRVKCMKCRRDLWITENTSPGVLYSLRCHHCGYDHHFWQKKTNRGGFIGQERLGEPIVNEVKVSPGILNHDRLPKTFCINPKECPISKDEATDVIFNMFADSDIDEDLMNRMLFKLMKIYP